MRGGGGWMESIPEETLSRTEAERVLRRLAGMLTPYRGRIALIIVVIAAPGRGAARRARAGRVRHRRGLAQGRCGCAQPCGRALPRARVRRAVPRTGRDPDGRRRRRVVPSQPAQAAVRPSHVAVARLLRTREDGPHRRPHDLRHRLAPGVDLARPRAVRAEHHPVHRRGDRHPVAVVGARARRARDRAAGLLRESVVPPRVEQGLPRSARAHRDQPFDAAGEPRGRARRAGLRARGFVHEPVLAHERGPVPSEPDGREDLGQVLPGRRVHGRGRDRGDPRVGWLSRRAGRRDGRRRGRVHDVPQQPVRADPADEPDLQHRAVGRCRAQQDLRRARHEADRRRTARRGRPARTQVRSTSTT